MTDAPTESATEIPTEVPTEAPTEAPTPDVTDAPTDPVTEPAGWAPETGPFNEGRVTYGKASDGTVTATPAEGYGLGLDITDKTDVVSICYSMWFDYILGPGTRPVTDWYNVTEVQAGQKNRGPDTAFHYWAKPFLLLTHNTPESFPLKELFTTRSMWGISVHTERGQWSYANPEIAGRITFGKDGRPEQVDVTTACQVGYMGTGTNESMGPGTGAVGRKGGKTWYVQWYDAFHVRPKVVTLTWWNEWAAQRIPLGGGQYAFVDNFNTEYSRDIEPMKGGHGDQYYRWLVQYISAYKAHLDCPMLVEPGEEALAEKLLRNVQRSLMELGLA